MVINSRSNHLHESYGCLHHCAKYCIYIMPKCLFIVSIIIIALYGGKTSELLRGEEVTCPRFHSWEHSGLEDQCS